MDQKIPAPEPGTVGRAHPVGTPRLLRDAAKKEDPQGTQRQENDLQAQQRPDGDGFREQSHQEDPAGHEDAENIYDPPLGQGDPPFYRWATKARAFPGESIPRFFPWKREGNRSGGSRYGCRFAVTLPADCP